MIRHPAVSGQFYPSNPDKLRKMLAGYIATNSKKERYTAVISPHAGYIYSGHVAGAVFSVSEVPDTVILLGPNHTGMGARFALMKEGDWATPLGTVPVNTPLAESIMNGYDAIEDDRSAHLREHSLEVQLPFLQYCNPKASIVPITIMYGSHAELQKLGIAVASAVSAYAKPVLIVVSSDMTHYESHESAKEKDTRAIQKVLNLDAQALLEVCARHNISMCGVLPAAVGIEAAKKLGAKTARLIKYATSGETSGDYDHVVGYAGIAIY